MKLPLVLLMGLVGAFALQLPAAEKADNPRYAIWANFKAGSSSTVSTDVDQQGTPVHIDVVKKLVSVSPEKVVVETTTTVRKAGQSHREQPVTEEVPAKSDKSDIHKTGVRELQVMGRTFKCLVWDATAENPNNSHPDQTDLTRNMKAVIYTNDQVPGGIVELDGVTQDGKPIVFVLTAMEAK